MKSLLTEKLAVSYMKSLLTVKLATSHILNVFHILLLLKVKKKG